MTDELSNLERRALDAWEPMAPPAGFGSRVVAARALPQRILAASLVIAALAAIVAVVVYRPWESQHSIATISRADGPIEHQSATTAWREAKVGDPIFDRDAVRTGDVGAELLLVQGRASIAMDRYTVLRFGGTAKVGTLSVELGAIELSGSGLYGLDVGDVRVDGRVRITAKGAQSEIQLLVGRAQVAAIDGKPLDLTVGTPYDLRLGPVIVAIGPVRDAGIATAPDDALSEAQPIEDITIEVAGAKGEVMEPGDGGWSALPAGTRGLAPHSRLRFGAKTSAKVSLVNGELSIEGGFATFIATGGAQIKVPGGVVALDGTPGNPAEARIDARSKDTAIAMLHGSGRLVGANSNELALTQGELASIERTGALRERVSIPSFFDMAADAGTSYTIHDPNGTTAVKFKFDGKCAGGGSIELDDDPRFRTARISAGLDAANHMVPPGAWSYRLLCTNGVAAASGRIVVRRDSGRRPLPRRPPTNRIDADGRNYRISYQSEIPKVEFTYAGGGSSWKLHVATGGAEETLETTNRIVAIAGNKLGEKTYTFWGEKDGVKSKVSTLVIDFDQTAPQVYIESPVDGQPWTDPVAIRGAVLPGWTASIDGVEVPIDPSTRRFTATVARPVGRALAIRLSHPQRGVHYYLRRR